MNLGLAKCVACAELIQLDAKLCKHCGVLQNDDRFVDDSAAASSASKRKKTSTGVVSPQIGSASTCPECGQSDSVANVGSIIDGGTSTSIGTGVMSQFGHPNNTFIGLSVGASSSGLASRLSISIPEPRFDYRFMLILIVFVGYQFFLWFSKTVEGAFWAVFMIGIGPAILAGLVGGSVLGGLLGWFKKRLDAKKLVEFQAKCLGAIQKLRAAYYCGRDDIVFSAEFRGSPEGVIEKLLR